MEGQLTNVVIDPTRRIRTGINESFEKAHVRAHTRKTKSGVITTVREYEDRREKHRLHANELDNRVKEGGRVLPEEVIRHRTEHQHLKNFEKTPTYKNHLKKKEKVSEIDDRTKGIMDHHRERIAHHRQEANKFRKMADAVNNDFKQRDLLQQLALHHENKFHEHASALDELQEKQTPKKNAGETVLGITIPNMKKFSKVDWYGFSGAERFSDGAAPLIGDLKVGDEVGLLIVDAQGVGVILESRPDDDAFFMAKNEKESLKLARHLQTKKSVTEDTLKQLNFRF